MKITMQIIIESITTKQKQVNLLSIRQKKHEEHQMIIIY